MQTFLTDESSLIICASDLDNRRLGKQRVEGLQIRRALAGKYNGAWENHPAVRMWRGYEMYLDNYIITMCMAWRDRGFHDNVEATLRDEFDAKYSFNIGMPPFVTERLCRTHRGQLYLKDPVFYHQWGLEALELDTLVCCDHCNYYWSAHDMSNYQHGGPYHPDTIAAFNNVSESP